MPKLKKKPALNGKNLYEAFEAVSEWVLQKDNLNQEQPSSLANENLAPNVQADQEYKAYAMDGNPTGKSIENTVVLRGWTPQKPAEKFLKQTDANQGDQVGKPKPNQIKTKQEELQQLRQQGNPLGRFIETNILKELLNKESELRKKLENEHNFFWQRQFNAMQLIDLFWCYLLLTMKEKAKLVDELNQQERYEKAQRELFVQDYLDRRSKQLKAEDIKPNTNIPIATDDSPVEIKLMTLQAELYDYSIKRFEKQKDFIRESHKELLEKAAEEIEKMPEGVEKEQAKAVVEELKQDLEEQVKRDEKLPDVLASHHPEALLYPEVLAARRAMNAEWFKKVAIKKIEEDLPNSNIIKETHENFEQKLKEMIKIDNVQIKSLKDEIKQLKQGQKEVMEENTNEIDNSTEDKVENDSNQKLEDMLVGYVPDTSEKEFIEKIIEPDEVIENQNNQLLDDFLETQESDQDKLANTNEDIDKSNTSDQSEETTNVNSQANELEGKDKKNFAGRLRDSISKIPDTITKLAKTAKDKLFNSTSDNLQQTPDAAFSNIPSLSREADNINKSNKKSQAHPKSAEQERLIIKAPETLPTKVNSAASRIENKDDKSTSYSTSNNCSSRR